MALILADRVQETTNTTGTGTLTLVGAVSGFQSFATIGNGNTTYYTIVSGTAWEVGIGTYTSAGTTLARTTILSSSASGAAISVSSGASVFATYPAERAINLDGGGNIPQAVTAGLGTTVLPGQVFYRLNSTLAGSNATGAQSILGVGVTLAGSTVYQFEGVFAFSKAAGTTSHTFGVGYGGTATLNNIGYTLTGQMNATGFTTTTTAIANILPWYIQTASNTAFTSSITTAAEYLVMTVKGTVSVNAGGTFIPQYTLSAAPGGAYTTALGSYFKMSPLGASGANTSIGTWA
jgi:hypothetical protein